MAELSGLAWPALARLRIPLADAGNHAGERADGGARGAEAAAATVRRAHG